MHIICNIQIPTRNLLSAVHCNPLQVPSEDRSNFRQQFPVFSAYGKEHKIEAYDQYDVDDHARLVYKYLKAFDSGRINSLFYPGKNKMVEIHSGYRSRGAMLQDKF